MRIGDDSSSPGQGIQSDARASEPGTRQRDGERKEAQEETRTGNKEGTSILRAAVKEERSKERKIDRLDRGKSIEEEPGEVED